MKEYFSHDFYARNDPKLKQISMTYGLEGIGLYWCVVEMLYEESGYLSETTIPAIAYDLRVTKETVDSLIDDFGLFVRDNGVFYSESILERLNVRNEKTEKAKKSAAARWEKSDSDANAMRTQCERNAIKEKKRKENKNTLSGERVNVCANAHEDPPTPIKKEYGKHGNVLLTDEEYADVKAKCPAYLDVFSKKLLKGYKFDDHYPILVQWAKEKGAYCEKSEVSGFDTDEFFNKAVKKAKRKRANDNNIQNTG